MAKLKDSLKTRNSNKIKTSLKEAIIRKIMQQINREKKTIAAELLVKEAAEDDAQLAGTPPDKGPMTKPINIVRSKPEAGLYRFQFAFKSRVYVVEFKEEGSGKYHGYFYTKGFKEDPKFSVRFGISSMTQIEPVFVNVMRAVEMFLDIRKPQIVRFGPGAGIKFPSIFHQYIYPELKNAEERLKKHYSVVRGDAIKDGSAFVLKKGGTSSILRNKSWKPNEADKESPAGDKEAASGAEVQEEIANVSGAGVSTDRPTKSGMGFPNLSKETDKEKERMFSDGDKIPTAMERRK